MKSFATISWRTLLMATFALWFGGFVFYVSFVVPIGTEVLGSAREQGFITRLVTHKLNLVCGIALAAMTVESWLTWSTAGRRLRILQLVLVALMWALLVGLVVLHPQLDGMLDLERRRVSDRQTFYGLHRVYLWLSTFQWIFAWFWLFGVVFNWTSQKRPTSAAESPSAS